MIPRRVFSARVTPWPVAPTVSVDAVYVAEVARRAVQTLNPPSLTVPDHLHRPDRSVVLGETAWRGNVLVIHPCETPGCPQRIERPKS